MNAAQFSDAQAELGFSNSRMAKWMQVTKSTVKNWRSGRVSIPGPAITLITERVERERLIEEHFKISEAWKHHCSLRREANRIQHTTVRALKSRGWGEKSLAYKYLRCVKKTFIEWITSHFKPGMTLKNHGLWELDHHIPLCSAETMDDLIKLGNYKNIKPMWREKHWSKGKRIPKTTLDGEVVNRG